jgi:putative ABC transport system permease protein
VAVSVALITCAGLLGRSMLSLAAIDAGFSARNVVIASIDLEPLGYDEVESMVFWSSLRDRLAALPRARAVAITSDAPLSASRGMQEFYVPGVAEDEMPDVGHTMVTTGFFESLGVALRNGRTFTTADNLDSERVIVVNAPFAEKYWPGGDAEDKLIGESTEGPWYRVVGVVAAHRHADLRSPGAPRVYWPLQQLGRWRKGSAIRTVMLATDMPDGEAVAALRTTVDQLDPNLPIFDVGSLQRQVVAATAPERQVTALLATLAAIAVLLCGLGLVAVLGRWVTRRQHEIGIRLAVGAAPRDVVKLVVVRAVWLVGAGAGLGLLAYRSLAGLLTHYLYGVGFTDAVTLMAVGVTAVLLALAVCIAPARRAASTDPVVAIRAQ